MGKSYQKNILRTFKSTKSRFFAIFSIVALGVGFLAGLTATTPDMRDSLEKYLDDTNLYDLRVVSTLGLTDEDADALRVVDGVGMVQPAYSADLLVQAGAADVVVSRAHSLPVDSTGSPEGADIINRLVLVEGRWPTVAGECVVEASATEMGRSFEIGASFTVTDDNIDVDDKMATREFTVVGIVHNSCYFSDEREPASVGNGSVAMAFYIAPQDFAYESYTEIYLTADETAPLQSLTDDRYTTLIEDVTDAIEGIKDVRCQARRDGILEEAREEIDDAWQEYNDAKAEADEELADAAAELADGREALADGEREISDGEKEYSDGLATLLDNEQQLADAQEAIQAARDQLTEGQMAYEDGVRQFAEGEAQLSAAKLQLEDAQRQYEQGKAAYDAGVAQVEAGEAQLTQGKLTLDAAQQQYDAGIAMLQTQGATMETAKAQCAQLKQLNAGQKAYDGGVQGIVASYAALGVTITTEQAEASFSDAALAAMIASTPESAMTQEQARQYMALSALNAAQKQLTMGVQGIIAANSTPEYTMTEAEARALFSDQSLAALNAQLNEGQAQLDAAKTQLDAAKTQLDSGWAEYNYNAEQLLAARAQLEANAPQLESARQQLESGWAEYHTQGDALYAAKHILQDSKKTLDEGFATLTDKQVELAQAQRQIADARVTLANARQELADARATIAEKAQELGDGEIEYADAVAEVEQELADARAEIEDAEKELNDLELPKWYIWDRSNNVSYHSFDNNVTKLAALAKVFPVFFFLVAALVVSTTMTRMVEEERLQIGTMKALGYTNRFIMKKYIWYALAAALVGTLFGLMIGFSVFPTVIWSAYTMMYYMPQIYTPWRLGHALLAGGSLTACTLVATWTASRATLRETPANLMRPRAPKAGKRILLERIGLLWRRLPFTYKVTCRNLMRYKKRFWMTVIGVAGCTALLVTGFGISDSLNGILKKQYGNVYHYDLMTAVTHEEDTERGSVYDYLFDTANFTASVATATEMVKQTLADGSSIEAYLMVPRDLATFASFVDLHDRTTGTPVPLGETGVILTEKYAHTLGVQAGDSITLQNTDEVSASFIVAGVCEHYVYNYIYMSEAAYEAGFGVAPSYNTILSSMPDDNAAARDAASADLLRMDEVAGLTFTVDSMVSVQNMLTSINAVVVLIVVCAAALAFVVLYNLTNINIAERVKEIATIKVLGFYEREVGAYVNRESVVLTLIGALVGLGVGIALHKFVILTVEVDAVMFGRDIEPASFLYAFVLTMMFGVVVNLIMGRKLKRISMVESMKAPE